ncbi:hypothetical protein [Micromonospora echinofusca]|uniref:MT0933-like antitoxin protein n=1 Tax=Micromonospora echinofusca TaxID=47858 RepID=A0ABS3VTD2_MICEH|nr:hypothetical protein [Micromonospora echinofusca]MBO4207731.1 hypothetical protein [Micromonospora echinofusca]
MAGSEQARKIAEKAEDQLGKVADTVKEKFDQLSGGRLADRNDQVDKGPDQARERAQEGQGGKSGR